MQEACRTQVLKLGLNFRVINKANFKWDVGVNAGTYKNKILSVPDGMFVTNMQAQGYLQKMAARPTSFMDMFLKGYLAQ